MNTISYRDQNCRGMVFDGEDLSNADFTNADLGSASLRHCKLDGALFVNADLSRADISGSELATADLSGCSLLDVRGIEWTGVRAKSDGDKCRLLCEMHRSKCPQVQTKEFYDTLMKQMLIRILPI